jgi:hypothetical protein
VVPVPQFLIGRSADYELHNYPLILHLMHKPYLAYLASVDYCTRSDHRATVAIKLSSVRTNANRGPLLLHADPNHKRIWFVCMQCKADHACPAYNVQLMNWELRVHACQINCVWPGKRKAAESFNSALVLRLSFFLIAAKVVAREIELVPWWATSRRRGPPPWKRSLAKEDCVQLVGLECLVSWLKFRY